MSGLGSDDDWILSLQLSFCFQTLNLPVTRNRHPTVANKFNDSPQLIAIKPTAVLSADVNDHTRTTREIYSVHDPGALRTFNVMKVQHILRVDLRERLQRGRTEHHRLFFAIGTNLFETRHIHPQSFALRTFRHARFAELDSVHCDMTFRTGQRRRFRSSLHRQRAAMRTKLLAVEHQAETRRAGDRGETRPAMLAFRGIAGRRRAAHRAIEGLRVHKVAALG